MKMKQLSIFMLMLGLSVGLHAQTKWKVDKAHSGIKFAVTHMMIAEVEGKFTDFEGNVSSPSDDFAGSEVSFTGSSSFCQHRKR